MFGAAEAAAIPSLLTCYATCGLVEPGIFSSPFGRATATAETAAATKPKAATKTTSPSTTRRTAALASLSSCSNMKRASVSRRSLHITSPPLRSRSSERWTEDKDGYDNNKDDYDIQADDTGRTLGADEEEDVAAVVAGVLQQHHSHHKPSRHVRAISDPFDTQQLDVWEDAAATAPVASATTNGTTAGQHVRDKESDHREDVEKEQLQHHQQQKNHQYHQPLFTLPRFPVADSRNKNCWNEPPLNIFSVRSLDYFGSGTKVPSAPFLLRARGCDLFVTSETSADNESTTSGGSGIELEERTHSILGGQLRRLPTLLVNFRFPWGFMVLYFEVPATLVPYMLDDSAPLDPALSVPEQVFAKWLQGDDEYKNERLKLIPYVAEGPWVVRNMVTGRPAIIGKRLPVTYDLHDSSSKKKMQQSSYSQHQQQPLLCCTLDIGNSSATAKRIVSVCRRYMSSLTVDIGFVIQAETECELPEQMMGAIRIHGPDPLRAVPLR